MNLIITFFTAAIVLITVTIFQSGRQLKSTRKLSAAEEMFYKLLSNVVKKNNLRMSDKFNDHTYQNMYGKHLHPYMLNAHHLGTTVKFFEIGLGCDMTYGPGASAEIWRALYPKKTDLWFAEFDGVCVNAYKEKLRDLRISTVVGDQGNVTHVRRWVNETGGNFDIIIDDGRHSNHCILTSFNVLFDQALKPGGLYFIEDLQVGRHFDPKDGAIVAEVLEDWIDQLLIDGGTHKYPIPKGIQWIACQREACVIEKCDAQSVRCK